MPKLNQAGCKQRSQRGEGMSCHAEANPAVCGETHRHESSITRQCKEIRRRRWRWQQRRQQCLRGFAFLLRVSFTQRRATLQRSPLRKGRKKAFCRTKVGCAASVESEWSVAACLPATRRPPQSFLCPKHITVK